MTTLRQWSTDLSELTDAEREAYRACRARNEGVRAFARRSNRAPGTVGNLLARADQKLQNQP